jgi:Spy/CpxP family protein refolding chaperone
MKNTWFIILFLGIVQLGLAQNPRGNANFQNRTADEIADQQTQTMKDSLSLSEEQIPKIRAVNLKYAQKMKDIWASDSDQMTKFQDMQVSQTNREYELKKLLTKEQAKVFVKMQERMRARMQERMQNRERKN